MRNFRYLPLFCLVLSGCSNLPNTDKQEIDTELFGITNGIVSASTSTAPTKEVKSAFTETNADLMKTNYSGLKTSLTKYKIANFLLSAALKVGTLSYIEPLSVQFKRNLVENPFDGIGQKYLAPDVQIPNYAVVDQFNIGFGFPFTASMPVPSVPGLTAGLGVGMYAGLNFINLRSFTDPNLVEYFNRIDRTSPEWSQLKEIPEWIYANRQIHDSMRVMEHSNKLGKFNSLGNMLTFPVRFPFSHKNIDKMYDFDVFSYSTYGTISFNGFLVEGFTSPGFTKLTGLYPNTIISDVSTGAFAGMKVGANFYATGKWKVAIQKISSDKMRVMVSEIAEIGGNGELSVGGDLSIFAKVDPTANSEEINDSTLGLSFLKLKIGKRKLKSFRRIYEYNIGTNEHENPEVFKAYLQSLIGYFNTTDEIINQCKIQNNRKCPVRWLKNITTNESETRDEEKIGIFIADISKVSSVKFINSDVNISSAEIHSVSSIVQHTFNRSHLGLGKRWKETKKGIKLSTSSFNKKREESFIFANEIVHKKDLETNKQSDETTILTRWNYKDTFVTEKDFNYLEDFFTKVLGYNKNDSGLFKDLSSLTEQFKEVEMFRNRRDYPFEATMQVGILPKLFKECFDGCSSRPLNPTALLYKAFVFDPEATDFPTALPGFLFAFKRDMSFLAKMNFSRVARQLNDYLQTTNPEERVKAFAKLTNHSSVTPELFTFFNYLATAILNESDSNLFNNSIFEPNKRISPNGVYNQAQDKISTYFHIQSLNLQYNTDINGEIFDFILSRMVKKNYDVIDIE